MGRLTSLRPITSAELASALRLAPGRLLGALSELRAAAAARTMHICYPGRAGRPLQLLAHVSLKAFDRRTSEAFEAWRREDGAVTQAVLLAGRSDYALWSFHVDHAAARIWLQTLKLRPEVRTVECRTVEVLFGHLFPGAPVFPEPRSRRSAVDR